MLCMKQVLQYLLIQKEENQWKNSFPLHQNIFQYNIFNSMIKNTKINKRK